MMAGNPSWWSMQNELRSTSDHHTHDHHNNNNHHHEQESNNNTNNMFISQIHPSNNNNNSSLLPIEHNEYLHGSSSTSSSSSLMPFISLVDHHHHAQEFPHSWSQLLLGGMASEQEEERFISTTPSHFQSTRLINDVKSEVNSRSNNNNYDDDQNNNNNLYRNQYHHDDQQQQQDVSSLGLISNNRATTPPWSQLMPISSPKSCITTLSTKNTTTNNNDIINNNMLDFTTNKRSLDSLQGDESHQHVDHSNSECNSSANGGVTKKPRVQSSSSNPPLKVRKEKLGDRITSLHQLVSPFGKTDTASVLLEAIGYIRFLQSQIEALSSPYLASNNASVKNPHPVHGERNCLFPDHPGQLLNDSCMKRRGATNQEDKQGVTKDLKSRGLCLVPISCTQLVGSDNGADYWAQSLGGGF